MLVRVMVANLSHYGVFVVAIYSLVACSTLSCTRASVFLLSVPLQPTLIFLFFLSFLMPTKLYAKRLKRLEMRTKEGRAKDEAEKWHNKHKREEAHYQAFLKECENLKHEHKGTRMDERDGTVILSRDFSNKPPPEGPVTTYSVIDSGIAKITEQTSVR